MTLPTDPDHEQLLGGRADWIGPEVADALARDPLASIETEYPHYARSVESAEETVQPSDDHPVFYGCYDWHSAVHSHWALVRQLRLFDEHPSRSEIVESIDERLTAETVAGEVSHFEENPSFEKPYGWAWLLLLDGELSLWDDERAAEWRSALDPLTDEIRSLVHTEFLTQDRPFRVGTHQNSAFALGCVLDYARTVGDDDLESAVCDRARDWFGDDTNYPVQYEPLGWDFLSPGLVEADLLRRVYDDDEFRSWVDSFLPNPTAEPHDSVLDPIELGPDPEEGVALHFVGLNVSKAWCLAGLADTLGDHPAAEAFTDSAGRHAETGLDRAFTDDYAGSHWLSSFVLYLLTRNEDGIDES